jgi:hypothetical protein
VDHLTLAREHLTGATWTRRQLEAALGVGRGKASDLLTTWREAGLIEHITTRGWWGYYRWVDVTPRANADADAAPDSWWSRLTLVDQLLLGVVPVLVLALLVLVVGTMQDDSQRAQEVPPAHALVGMPATAPLTATSAIPPFLQPDQVRGYAEPSLGSAMQVLDGGVPVARYGRDWVLMRHPEQGEFWVRLADLAGVPEFDSLPDAEVPAPPPLPTPLPPSVPTQP